MLILHTYTISDNNSENRKQKKIKLRYCNVIILSSFVYSVCNRKENNKQTNKTSSSTKTLNKKIYQTHEFKKKLKKLYKYVY